MGRSRYHIINERYPHFITITVLHWIPVFTRKETVQIILEAMHFITSQGIKIRAYVILENHMHMVIEGPNIQKQIESFKKFTAKKILKYLQDHNVKTILDQLAFYKKSHKVDRAYQFWQEGCCPKAILNETMLQQKIDYIHYNPVKRGYVELPEHWCYSSAKKTPTDILSPLS